MPVLSNAKYELFCQHLALGKTASEAYELAGYKPSGSNASVLRAKQSISGPLAEILQESEKKVVKQIEHTREASWTS
jgi:phage terminase small subunit